MKPENISRKSSPRTEPASVQIEQVTNGYIVRLGVFDPCRSVSSDNLRVFETFDSMMTWLSGYMGETAE